MNLKKWLIILLALTNLLVSCSKEKVPKLSTPIPSEPTKWEKISGDYKVHDTLGNYLYNVTISHTHNSINDSDSLHFSNYGNLFTLTQFQTHASNLPEGYIDIGSQNPIKDKFGKRWDLSQATDIDFNVLNNDTVVLKYRRVNILYYLEDLTPYCDTTIIEVAVKQH